LIHITIAAFVAILGVQLAYQISFLIFYLCSGVKHEKEKTEDKYRFAIIIPSHNEEKVIEKALIHCFDLNYQKEKYDVYVVADNCEDGTKAIAERFTRVRILERVDKTRVGKPYALEYAFKHIDISNVDAVVVLDADSIIAPNFLTVMSGKLGKNHRAIQGRNEISNWDRNMFTYLMAVGNVIVNSLLFTPRSRLGLDCFILGTGYCLHKSLLPLFIKSRYSISEDIELSLELLRRNEHIEFAENTWVRALQPTSMGGATSQRIRWGSGTFLLLLRYATRFVRDFLEKPSTKSLDRVLFLLIWSKPLIILQFVALLVASIVMSTWTFPIVILFIAQMLYYAFPVFILKKYRLAWRAALKLPLVLGWVLVIQILNIAGFKKNLWTRTKR
jgi:1,2-diacylglycerol 3-beta-glucosyltransferase